MFSMVATAVSGSKLLNYLRETSFDIVKKGKIEYYNVASAFDIEVSSFTQVNGEKQCCVYSWCFGVNGITTVGRTLKEYLSLLNEVSEILEISEHRHLIIYVHNLAYEFQFLKDLCQWDKIFSLKERKPVYAITNGIEYRCSYKLAGYALATVGENLMKYKVKKLSGELDYSLVRTPETPLTQRELQYQINDVLVVMAMIQEKIENEGDITSLPLTNTGYVRNACRQACMFTRKSHRKGGKKFKNYRRLMKALVLTADDYSQLKRAFAGGFTHANFRKSFQTHKDVGSFDFTSSYPYVMIAEKFPMSAFTQVNIDSNEQLRYYLKNYCCLFDVRLTGIKAKDDAPDHTISASKCSGLSKGKFLLDNGRIVWADQLCTTLTEIDFQVVTKFYDFEKIEFYNFKIAHKGYLPTDLVKVIIDFYKDKTTLKGVEGKEVEYLRSKGMINACYGMMVTDICRDEISFTQVNEIQWGKTKPILETAIETYNNSFKRFLYYPWGVWVTSYARRNLFTGILACGNDYLYSDTDSIKILNPEKHLCYINSYNDAVNRKLKKAMEFHKFNFDETRPKTIKGEEKPIGIWDYEGNYERFKTIGAKRYLYEDTHGKFHLTVSGVNKKLAMPYMESLGDPFQVFDDGLVIPPDYSGKKILTYIDTPMEGWVTDYLGNEYYHYTPSGIHMENSAYDLKAEEYKHFCGVETEIII